MIVLSYIGLRSRDAKVVTIADYRCEREMAAVQEAMSARRRRNHGVLGLNSLKPLIVAPTLEKEPA